MLPEQTVISVNTGIVLRALIVQLIAFVMERIFIPVLQDYTLKITNAKDVVLISATIQTPKMNVAVANVNQAMRRVVKIILKEIFQNINFSNILAKTSMTAARRHL